MISFSNSDSAFFACVALSVVSPFNRVISKSSPSLRYSPACSPSDASILLSLSSIFVTRFSTTASVDLNMGQRLAEVGASVWAYACSRHIGGSTDGTVVRVYSATSSVPECERSFPLAWGEPAVARYHRSRHCFPRPRQSMAGLEAHHWSWGRDGRVADVFQCLDNARGAQCRGKMSKGLTHGAPAAAATVVRAHSLSPRTGSHRTCSLTAAVPRAHVSAAQRRAVRSAVFKAMAKSLARYRARAARPSAHGELRRQRQGRSGCVRTRCPATSRMRWRLCTRTQPRGSSVKCTT